MKQLALKTFMIICGFFLIVSAVIIGGSYFWYVANTQPVSKENVETTFVINSGETFSDVADRLEQDGLIKSAFAFKLWTKLSGEEVTVQAGKHTLSPSMEYKDIVHELSVGIEDIKVLFKEGVRVEEMADILEQNLDKTFNKADFLKLAKPKEGMMFPDTYIYQKSTEAQTIVTQLNSEFEKRYEQLGGPTQADQKKKIVILASLLEREGRTDIDRPIIAGILLNRLNKNTETVGLLQVDATLQYALNETKKNSTVWWPVPRVEDKEIDSPYNTYKYQGLPPGPICNPGMSALKAAINPQESDYLYYIHDNSGKAYYARTLDEHNVNIARYLQ